MLRLENIKKSYGTQEVLDVPYWEVKQGEAVALLGANATGKTTLLEIIAGLLHQSEGVVYYDGDPITGPRRDIGIVLQNPIMFTTTIAGNVSLSLLTNRLNRKEKTERINRALTMVGMDELGSRSATGLSEGQKQRVAIARILALQPELLLLDEPTASLDKENTQHIAKILRELNENEGLTIIVATHDLDFASQIAKRMDILRDGRPEPYISGNIYSGTAVIKNGVTEVIIKEDLTISVGSNYSGKVDVVIPPEQIVLSNKLIESSMRNNFHGRIVRLEEINGLIKVTVDISLPLEASLTRSALTDLGVTIGDDVYVSFKAHGIMVFPREERINR